MTMQAGSKALWVVLAASLAAIPAAGDERPGRGWRHGDGPSIVIEPQIDLTRRRPAADEPGVILADVEVCARAGVRSFVDCLRGNHRSVTIRRLEACVASETIPDDLGRVAACLPPSRMR